MLEKYGPRGFVVIAVNTVTAMDELVVPFIRNNSYGFLPARANVDWKRSSYKVVGTPTNFLVDAQGRIIFKPRVHNDVTERTLGLEIEALLGK